MSTEQQEIVKPKKTWAELAEDEDEEIAQSENAIRDVDSLPEPAFIKTQSEYVNKTYNRKGGYNKEGRRQNNRENNGLKDYRQKQSEYEPAKYDNNKKQHYSKGQSTTQGGGGIKGRIETLLLYTKQETVNIRARIQDEQANYNRLEDHFRNNYQEMEVILHEDNILLRVSPQTALQLLRNIGIQGEIDGQLVKLSYPRDDQERPQREPKPQRVEPEVLDRHFYKPSKPTTVVTRSVIKVEEQLRNVEQQRVEQQVVNQQNNDEQFNEKNSNVMNNKDNKDNRDNKDNKNDRDDKNKDKYNDEQPIQEFTEQIRPSKYESTYTSNRSKQSYNKPTRFTQQQSQYVEKHKVDDEPHSNNDCYKPYPNRGKNNQPKYEYQVKYEEVPQPAQESPVRSDDEPTSSAKKRNKKKKPHRKQSENSTNPFSALAQK